MARKLAEYERKRDPARTNEPFAAAGEAGGPTTLGAFVVHLHDATRRHFDLRVEIGGVLASFALPKGPTFDPEQKHLAVHTEDHPLEYLDFEAVIPAGQYGGGPMILWDRGAVQYIEAPAEDGMKSGKLDMLMSGHKMNGRFALVRLEARGTGGAGGAGGAGRRKTTGKEWLLIKKKDAFSTKEPLPEPRSILSGLAIHELEEAPKIAAELEALAAKKGAQMLCAKPAAAARLTGRKAKVGKSATASAAATRGEGGHAPLVDAAWIYEVKLDGARVRAEKRGDHVVLTHAGREVTEYYAEVARAVRALAPSSLVLEGDVVAFEGGRPSLPMLLLRNEQTRGGHARDPWVTSPVTYVVSDLLSVGERDASMLPLTSRKELVRALLRAPGILRAGEWVKGDGAKVMGFAEAHGLEGVVARRDDGTRTELLRAKGAAVRPETIDHDAQGAPGTPPALSSDARPPVRFPVTNRAKVFWPEDGLTKGDLCDYYEAIAPALLPYLRDRPMALVRYPDGIHGKSFFQWNVPLAMPKWMKTLALRPDEDDKGERTLERRGFLVNDLASLTYIANLGCIPIHLLAWRASTTEECDFLTLDFDPPKEGLDPKERITRIVRLTLTLRGLLERIGLVGYPKTSGQAGIHVLVPLGAPFETAKSLCELLGRLVVQEHPDIATMDRVVGRRGTRIYVDTGQTGHGRTIVAPYSVRAQPGATVSTPLDWDEVSPSLDPRAFSMKAVVARVAERGDPMRALVRARADVASAAGRLRALVAR